MSLGDLFYAIGRAMRRPFCHHEETVLVDEWRPPDGPEWEQRECIECGAVFELHE